MMCLPAPRRRALPPVDKGKSPSSFSSSGSSAGSDPPLSPRKHRPRGPITASTSSDLPIRLAKIPPGQPLRTSAPLPTRKSSTKKRSRGGSVNGSTNGNTVGGPVSSLPPSRRSSTRGRDSSRLAPASPMVGPVGRSPAMSTRSTKNTPTPSPTKRSSSSQHRSSSRSKYLETPSSQQSSSNTTPLPSPRIPREKRGKDKSKRDMDIRPGDRLIAARVPMEDGGSVSGLMVVRPGSSRRGSDNGSHKSESSKGSGAGDIQPKRSAKVAAAPPPIGLGITMGSPMPPPSKVVEKRLRESEVQARPATLPVPRISVQAPPTPVVTQPAMGARAMLAQQSPTAIPAPPTATASAPAVAPATLQKYPIIATMSYPTSDQLAYKPIDRSQVPSTNFPGKVMVAPVTPIVASAPMKAPQKARAPAVVAPPAKPPPTSRVPPSQPPVTRAPVGPLPPAAKPHPPLAPTERPASIASSVSSSTTATSSSLSASSTASEQPTPRQITYSPHPVSSPGSSSSSLVSVSSSSSSSTTTSSAHPQRIPSSEPIVPEMSGRKPAYYRYAPKKDTSQKRIMDSPAFPQGDETVKPRKPAGPWDGRPGADPGLGAYYRTAEAEKLKQSKSHSRSGETWVDEANLANYYKQADVQKRKMALEKMKREQEYSDNESVVSSSVASSTASSEAWVDPNVATYYRHAKSEKEKKQLEVQTPKKQQPAPRPGDEKALRIYSSPPIPAINNHHPSPGTRLRHVRGGLPSHPVPPPAPTPPPPDTTDTETLGDTPTEKKPGPPKGAAEAWFQASMAAKGESASDYWNSSKSTIESPEEEAGGEKVEFPEGLPPAPTPPLSREDTPAGVMGGGSYYSTGGYNEEKKKGYRR